MRASCVSVHGAAARPSQEVLQRSLPAGGQQDRASLRLQVPPLPLESRKAPSEPFGNSGQQPPRPASACRKRPFTTQADRPAPACRQRTAPGAKTRGVGPRIFRNFSSPPRYGGRSDRPRCGSIHRNQAIQYIRGDTATFGCIVGPPGRAATCHDIQTRSPWGFPRALSCSVAWMRSRPTSAWTGPKPFTRLSCTGSSRKSARLPSVTAYSRCVRGRRPTCAPREDTAGQPFSVFQRTAMSGSSPSCLRSQGCPTDC